MQAAQPPILIDNGVAVLENDLIERHIMKKIPGGHNLFVPDQVRFSEQPWHNIEQQWLLGSQQEDWECLQQVQVDVAEEGWHEQKSSDQHFGEVCINYLTTYLGMT